MATSLVFFSISDIKIAGARHLLAEEGIESFTIDKKDSVYAGILGGKIEMYVRQEDEEAARKILDESGILDE